MTGGLYLLLFLLLALVVAGLFILCGHSVRKSTTEAITKEFEAKMESLAMGQELLVSQIQPHFIYNVLNTIKYLCKRNPEEALYAIDCFSSLLRESMHTFNSTECIPFSQEMGIVENYVYLEKCRFGDKVEVITDTAVTDFCLPSLSVQPLVENAIKHGITKKLGGGTVWIKTYRDEDNNYVEITDNGVGFFIDDITGDGKKHIGIKNTAQRIQTMCKGKLTIDSEIDKATRVLLTVPREN